MALIKEDIQPNQSVAKYWIIANVSASKITESANVTLLGYPDRDTRLNQPRQGLADRRQFTIPTEDFEVIYGRVVEGSENIFKVLYKYVKGVEKGDDTVDNPVYWTDGESNLSWFSDATSDHKDI